MNAKRWIVAGVAAAVIAACVGVGIAEYNSRRGARLHQEAMRRSAAHAWAVCAVLIAERGRATPSYGADFFAPATDADKGAVMETTAGPAAADLDIMRQFRWWLYRDESKAGRIIDGGQLSWLRPGRRVELVELTHDGIAAIRPAGGGGLMYVMDWSIRRAQAAH